MPAAVSWMFISHGKKLTCGSSSIVVNISTVLTVDVIVKKGLGGLGLFEFGKPNNYLTLLSVPQPSIGLMHEC